MLCRQIEANIKRWEEGGAPLPIDGGSAEPPLPPPPSVPPPPGAPPPPMSYLEKLRAEASAEAAQASAPPPAPTARVPAPLLRSCVSPHAQGRLAQKRAEISHLEEKVRMLRRKIGEAEAAGA